MKVAVTTRYEWAEAYIQRRKREKYRLTQARRFPNIAPSVLDVSPDIGYGSLDYWTTPFPVWEFLKCSSSRFLWDADVTVCMAARRRLCKAVRFLALAS